MAYMFVEDGVPHFRLKLEAGKDWQEVNFIDIFVDPTWRNGSKRPEPLTGVLAQSRTNPYHYRVFSDAQSIEPDFQLVGDGQYRS